MVLINKSHAVVITKVNEQTYATLVMIYLYIVVVLWFQVALPMVPNSAAVGTGPNTPQGTPQRPRRASSADGRREHGSPQLPQYGPGGSVSRQQSAPATASAPTQRPQSGGDYGSPSHYMPGAGGTPASHYAPASPAPGGRTRVSGSPAPQQAPPPQPIYAVPQIQPHTVMQDPGVGAQGQYASLQHHVIQQAPPPSQYMQLPLVNNTSSSGNGPTAGGATTARFMIGNPDSDEDDPNWPPPPPPEYMTVDGAETGASSTDPAHAHGPEQHRGSVQESHASIIQSLNAKVRCPSTDSQHVTTARAPRPRPWATQLPEL